MLVERSISISLTTTLAFCEPVWIRKRTGFGAGIEADNPLKGIVAGDLDGHIRIGAGGFRGQHQAEITVRRFNHARGNITARFVDSFRDAVERSVAIGKGNGQRLGGARLGNGHGTGGAGGRAKLRGAAGDRA